MTVLCILLQPALSNRREMRSITMQMQRRTMARTVALLQAWALSRLGIQPAQITSPLRKQHRIYRSVNTGITVLKACTHVLRCDYQHRTSMALLDNCRDMFWILPSWQGHLQPNMKPTDLSKAHSPFVCAICRRRIGMLLLGRQLLQLG